MKTNNLYVNKNIKIFEKHFIILVNLNDLQFMSLCFQGQIIHTQHKYSKTFD